MTVLRDYDFIRIWSGYLPMFIFVFLYNYSYLHSQFFYSITYYMFGSCFCGYIFLVFVIAVRKRLQLLHLERLVNRSYHWVIPLLYFSFFLFLPCRLLRLYLGPDIKSHRGPTPLIPKYDELYALSHPVAIS